MGFFDRLFRRSSGKPLASDELRRRLFDAVAAGDEAALAALCAAHEEAVLAGFPEWKRVPEAFRTPEKLAWYGPGLIAVAEHFAEQRGRPELLESMMGTPEDNPLLRWQRALEEAGALMDELRYEEAAERLREAIAQAEGLQGSGVDRYLPITSLRLGECLLQLGDADGARAVSERALERCERTGDAEGIAACLGNLYEIQRYRGDAGAAAASLERLAATLERMERGAEAARARRQADIVRAGEPPCRVVAEIDGQTMELSDLSTPEGSIRFVFERNRLALRRSGEAVKQGIAAAERGELEPALRCFERAAAADPFDPWPSYHAGMALMELRRYGEAAASYRITEALAPGWYHCRSDAWLAERLASGALDHDTFSDLRRLQDGGLPPSQRAAIAEAALQRHDLGLLRLFLGEALHELGREAEGQEALRRGLAITEEPDVRTRLLVSFGARAKDPTESTRSLHEAMELSGNPVAAAMARLLLMASPEASRS